MAPPAVSGFRTWTRRAMSCVAVSIVLASGAGAGCASEPEHRTAETSYVEIDTISSFDISAGGRKFRVHGAAQLGACSMP